MKRTAGLTLVEMLIALLIASVVVGALTQVLSSGMQMNAAMMNRASLQADADFAMQRIGLALARTPELLVPQVDNTKTSWKENLRRETVPASSPQTGSTRDSAVLAVAVDMSRDLDGNGVPDCDNDGDGKCSEDSSGDRTDDDRAGIAGIDDNGDGVVDNGGSGRRSDDDEDGASGEDPVNGLDDDNDGRIDEDPSHDRNADGKPGIAGVDDDGATDEGFWYPHFDNDEDGDNADDPMETTVFYVDGSQLIERTNVPWDSNNSGDVTSADLVREVIAENITLLSFERLADSTLAKPVVRVIIELGASYRLQRDYVLEAVP